MSIETEAWDLVRIGGVGRRTTAPVAEIVMDDELAFPVIVDDEKTDG